MESVGFKEWAIVCQALGDGSQSIILRKGGIAEGGEGFAFRHRDFFLFPTFFHEQVEKTRVVGATPFQASQDEIEIQFFAKAELSRLITSLAMTESLAPLHVLKPAVVRERFHYHASAGLYVALVRIFRLKPMWVLPNEKSFGGCRSWVRLAQCPPVTRFEPVLADAEHAERTRLFVSLISNAAPAIALS